MNFEQALRRAETERDGARAAKNKVDNRLRARDKAYTNLAQERDKYKALSIKFEAEAKKADDLIKRYGWDGQYKSFAATMRDLPEPVDAPPPSRNKNGPCMTPGCSTPNSNITEIITQV
ncbi:hypothetical protein DAEQUDRAFT_37056 [Daedalea quercina L-15889]|uniref:Uncharacterized protein n=1 Tax=Daedalea quercina L-15889 TaxID=1314783 RepID=A0A165STE9_9APHY|nr:hypothetical protein DAEQUDRAFT_37056 [Daedalea quercina L-15889]